jgi:hypothetical protein
LGVERPQTPKAVPYISFSICKITEILEPYILAEALNGVFGGGGETCLAGALDEN